MDITVNHDETVRTIRLGVQTSETMVRNYLNYNGRVVITTFQPERVVIRVRPRETTVCVSGPRVLKSGVVSKFYREENHYVWDAFKDTAPEWLLTAVLDAIGEEPK